MTRETLTLGPGANGPRAQERGAERGLRVETRARLERRGEGPPYVERRVVDLVPMGVDRGVIVVEAGAEPTSPRPPRRGYVRPAARDEGPSPIEITELAARQIRLMAYRHGVMGAGLRIMTSGAGGPGDCDFAFEAEPEPEDRVFLSRGIRVIVDPDSLARLRGTRVTYQDLPGAEGFRLG